MPPAAQRDTPEAEAHVVRTTRLFEAAGRHFNRGQRAFFFALGYLGWFVSPWVLFVTTAAVVIVTWRRQFASNAWRAMGSSSVMSTRSVILILSEGATDPGSLFHRIRSTFSKSPPESDSTKLS
jgi:uncharacterized membrane protein